MKISKGQLRKLIREAVGDLVVRQARDILRHYDMIASDMGEIYVDDLIDHWYGQGNPEPMPGVRDEIVRQNYGDEYLR